jgi:predicted RND superfamily exporter protein
MGIEKAFRGYIRLIIAHSRIVLAATLVITVFFAYAARHQHIELAWDKSLPETHPYIKTYRLIQEKFGQSELVIAAFEPASGTILTADFVKMIGEITREIQALPYVNRDNVLSLTAAKAKDIYGTADGLEAHSFSEGDLATLKQRLERNTEYEGILYSRDFRTTSILIDFKRNNESDYHGREKALRGIIERHLLPGSRYGLGGFAIMLSNIQYFSMRLAIYFSLAVLIVGLIHYYSFRTLQGLFLPLVTALIAVIWATGVLGVLGINLNAATAPTPILLLAIAAGHAVQILKRYYEEFAHYHDNHRALEEAIVRVGPVMVLAGGIAAASFLSLLTFQLEDIRDFGLYSASGILAALAVEMTFTPALRSLLPAPDGARARRDYLARHLAYRASRLPGTRFVKPMLALLAVAGVIAGWLATRIPVNSESRMHFPHEHPFLAEDRWINESLSGTEFISAVIEGPADALKRPDTLRALAGLEEELRKNPLVGKTLSIADFVRKMNRAMHSDDPKFEVIPDSQDLVAQYLLLYGMSGQPTDFDTYVTNDYDRGNLTIFVKTSSTARGEEIVRLIQDYSARAFPKDVTVRISGSLAALTAYNDVMVSGKLRNILAIFVTVLLLAGLALRSPTGAVLASLPILMTVLFNFGLMALAGYTLNVATAITSALAVGVGVDYAIYFLFRLREELPKHHGHILQAVRAGVAHAGEAIILVSLAISLGYFALCLSPFGFHSKMGLLVGLSMLVSAFSSITVLPEVIAWLQPKFLWRWMQPGPGQTVGAVIQLGEIHPQKSGAPEERKAA